MTLPATALPIESPPAFLGVSQSLTGKLWRDRLDARGAARALAITQRHQLPELLARVLAGRDVDIDAVPDFLDPTIRKLMPDPFTVTQMEAAAQRIADAPGPASVRLRELITTIHRMNSERYVGDSKLHEMVEIAMEESWEVCVCHMELITQTIGGVIAQGVESGEFEVTDLALAAGCACTAMMRFFHPQMIAQCATKPGPTIDQMIDFVLAGLAPRAAK